MLQKHTVNRRLLELLTELMKVDFLNNFRLVGGTSLALQIGHRHSIDLDFFGNQELYEDDILSVLHGFGNVNLLKKSKNILICSVDDIKIDFVNYRYPWLTPPVIIDKIRLASKEDISAMKLNAISGRGSKKDFIDLYYLLNNFSLADMIEFYNKKYNDGSVFLVIKSLSYFGDADLDETPLMSTKTDWEAIKLRILKEVDSLLSE